MESALFARLWSDCAGSSSWCESSDVFAWLSDTFSNTVLIGAGLSSFEGFCNHAGIKPERPERKMCRKHLFALFRKCGLSITDNFYTNGRPNKPDDGSADLSQAVVVETASGSGTPQPPSSTFPCATGVVGPHTPVAVAEASRRKPKRKCSPGAYSVTRVRARPRGNTDFLIVAGAARAAALRQLPGSYRSCPRCGYVRCVPSEPATRKLLCPFPGKRGWRCGHMAIARIWNGMVPFPEEVVEERNAACMDALKLKQQEFADLANGSKADPQRLHDRFQ